MSKKKTWLNLAIIFVIIAIASSTLSIWTTQYTYLHFKDEESFYLAADDEDNPISIEFPIREGTIIEARTHRITGDIDIDLSIQIRYNETFGFTVSSETVGSSTERILWENQIEVPFEIQISQYFPFGENYPYADLQIIPKGGKGMVTVQYEILQPVTELLYVCIIVIVLSLSFFIKDSASILHSSIKRKQE